ncbi:MAG: hypothetical protein ACRBBN_12050 [Methyloligellaceae bacterium]
MDWYLPDFRLSNRANQIHESIVSTVTMVLRRIGGDRAGEIAAHRFLDNGSICHEAIIDTLSLRTREACKGRRIVAVQDTTEINFSRRDASRRGLGIAAATRIVQLVDARDYSLRPAEDVIDPELIDPIDQIGKTLEGKTDRQKNPHKKGSLSWLSWIVARLGGWNCYYKPPGPKTMATGWKQLAAMAGGFLLATRKQDM